MSAVWGLAALLLLALAVLWRRYLAAQRREYIRTFELPRGLFDRLRKRRPELTQKDCQLVAQGLRQFFLTYALSGRQFVSMPSQVVDDLWHEFILYTKGYQVFCQKAFGGFLHHTPAVALSRNQQGNAGLRRCWWHACRIENINPRQPARLPLLFALDGKLGIEEGFRYVPDCQSVRRQGDDGRGGAVNCGGDFGNTSFDGGTEGFGNTAGCGDAFGGGGDAAGDGGGCGGGCGGD